MPITLGGQQCLDPKALFDLCMARSMPTEPWLGKANSYRCPLGPEPGRGHVLLSSAGLKALNIDGQHDLIFDDGQKKVTIKNLSMLRTTCVTPGVTSKTTSDSEGTGETWKEGDAAAAYFVELADRRERIRAIPANAAYNLRDCEGDGYFFDSLNWGGGSGSGPCFSGSGASGSGSGTDSSVWTWQAMVCDLAAIIPGMNSLCLPYSPQGYPENFAFWTSSAWHALNVIADRLGCAIAFNPFDESFQMVEVGKADSAFDSAFTAIHGLRFWDTDPWRIRAPAPREVRVLFPFSPPPTDGTTPWDYYDEDAPQYFPNNTLAVNELREKVWPQTVQYLMGDSGSPALAGQDLIARARERRDKFYQAYLDSAVRPMQKVLAGVHNATGLLPGSRVKAIAWYDFGTSDGGIKTEIYRGLNVCPPAMYQTPYDPETCCCIGDGGSGASANLGLCTESGSASGSGCACGLPIRDIFERIGNECFYRDGCLTIVDENGNPVNLRIQLGFFQ